MDISTMHKYTPLDGDEVASSAPSFEEDETLLEKGKGRPGLQPPRPPAIVWLAMATSILLNIVVAAIMLWSQLTADRRCLQSRDFYSPLLNVIDPEPVYTQFNGTLEYPSPWTGEPSEEIDAAWSEIDEMDFLVFSREELAATGWDPDEYGLMMPEEYGGGYMVYPEVLHMLHCVNFLRKSSFPDYYNSETTASLEWTDDPPTVRIHQNHCVELLRQSIMCHADVTVMTHNWVKGYPKPLPNFNTKHMCRNFDNVLSWMKTRRYDGPAIDQFAFPYAPGQKKFMKPPMPEVWYELHGEV